MVKTRPILLLFAFLWWLAELSIFLSVEVALPPLWPFPTHWVVRFALLFTFVYGIFAIQKFQIFILSKISILLFMASGFLILLKDVSLIQLLTGLFHKKRKEEKLLVFCFSFIFKFLYAWNAFVFMIGIDTQCISTICTINSFSLWTYMPHLFSNSLLTSGICFWTLAFQHLRSSASCQHWPLDLSSFRARFNIWQGNSSTPDLFHNCFWIFSDIYMNFKIILSSSRRSNPLGKHWIYIFLKRIYIFVIVSHSVLESTSALHLFRACFLSFSKSLLFSCTFLVKFISRYFMGFGPLVDEIFFSISSSVDCWNRKK